ncbi:hypothetical protein NHX12_016310 [Muraenolepis orangiensis]|uniref:Uncharacterized protein n=1 Tax=Muraenolepis orangiensis TaxID=630683 RepID=A0A9Q0D839_9TELE|nr:hypothetical protein NHX12_016310 [Muraenolepis orangiensis]
MYPESGGFHHGSKAPTITPEGILEGAHKRPLNRQVKPQCDGQKRKQMLTAGPESKTEAAWAEATEDTAGNAAEAGEEKTD